MRYHHHHFWPGGLGRLCLTETCFLSQNSMHGWVYTILIRSENALYVLGKHPKEKKKGPAECDMQKLRCQYQRKSWSVAQALPKSSLAVVAVVGASRRQQGTSTARYVPGLHLSMGRPESFQLSCSCKHVPSRYAHFSQATKRSLARKPPQIPGFRSFVYCN